MSNGSKIEWTGKTWNPCVGCTKISTGCKHCYAETAAASARLQQFPRYQKVITNGKWNGTTCLVESVLTKPLHWKQPQTIFVNSMGDLFHPTVPFPWIDKVLAIAVLSQQHTFQILTKYAWLMVEYFTLNFKNRIECIFCAAHDMLLAKHNGDIPEAIETAFNDLWEVKPLPNVWLGVTAENQDRANARIPALLKCPAAIRFISGEPMLEEIVIREWYQEIDWVICGGESQRGARAMDPAWARSLRQQCKAAGVPFFMKQMGGHPDKRGKLLDIPEDLRVREMPVIK